MGRLTTHVLDACRGCPASGLRIELFRAEADTRAELKSVTTNDDGRVDRPLLQEGAFERGVYELVFHAGDYFRRCGAELPDPPFLDRISIRFGVSDEQAHYHVPLLVTPWSYSTYRGS